jgi:hypothetical protein
MANGELELSFRSAEKNEYELRPRRHDRAYLPYRPKHTVDAKCMYRPRYNELIIDELVVSPVKYIHVSGWSPTHNI